MISDTPLHILAIDDQEHDAELLRRQLSRVPALKFEFVHCAGPEDAERVLEETPVDLIFLDYRLDGADTGLDVLRALRSGGDLRPIVVLTGQGDEYLAAEITRCGADDYIVKSDLDPELLRRAIDNADAQYRRRLAERELARRHKEIERLTDELARANIELAEGNRRDCLTGLLNRGAWEKAISVEHDRMLRHGPAYSVIMLDVDHFKQFNDTQGHQAGDACLRRVAQCLTDATRTIDFVGRYGGEEFVILCPETTLDDAHTLAERIRSDLERLALPHPASPTAPHVTASFGVAAGLGETWELVTKNADDALYAAKNAGRNRTYRADGELAPAA